ncbi:hypothetical protein DL93DRAFT_2103241 [Clavulina sp. PMI_390]|nr:hypothetical protein DL93DRAFT_2103241 [Clavulina sp. PMI_390]
MTMVMILAQMNDPYIPTFVRSGTAAVGSLYTTQDRPFLASSLDRVGVIGGGCGSVEQNASEEGGGLARPSWADYQCDPAHDLVAAVALKCCLDKCVAYLVVLATQHSPSMHMRALMVASPRVAPNPSHLLWLRPLVSPPARE